MNSLADAARVASPGICGVWQVDRDCGAAPILAMARVPDITGMPMESTGCACTGALSTQASKTGKDAINRHMFRLQPNDGYEYAESSQPCAMKGWRQT
jgi:hypothetical protein